MSADQEQAADLSLIPTASRETTTTTSTPSEIFRFLELPIELRLKIYAYLLPARTHTIVTQIPNNGYFYNTSTIPSHSAQSFYPFGRAPPKSSKLTTYKILNTNFRAEFPALGIFPQILRVSKQVQAEAEPVLYGANGVLFDFGIYLEALSPFFRDRSERARNSVRSVRIAREIPEVDNREGDDAVSKGVDPRWESLCAFLKQELVGLRSLDLTMWSSSGSVASFPSSTGSSVQMVEDEEMVKMLAVERWREWEWTRDLLQLEALRKAKITWWGYQSIGGSEGEHSFDSWLARRMVGDRLVTDRMIREGVVVE
jgi:hypothetical protein